MRNSSLFFGKLTKRDSLIFFKSETINLCVFLSYRYKNGRPRPYTVQLGRIIKQRLWEKLNCPQISLQEGDNGLLMVSELHEDDVYPPLIEVDISHEPDPREPSWGRKAKHC